MLTLEQRPKTFAQLAGQDLVKKTLMHIINDPINSPKTLLLLGPYGSGKTTAARIFARALNCPNRLPNGDACGRDDCPMCGSEIQDSMFYSEYDSALVGNVDSIRELRNTFYFGYEKGYKIIVLDEIHLISRTAQGALLKVFEEPEENVFFLLCTTDPEKLLPTIVSRSLELRFTTIQPDDMYNHLAKIVQSKGLELTPEIQTNLKTITTRSHGHMRNAIMMLDTMFILKGDFADTLKDSTLLFKGLITAALYKAPANYDQFIDNCIKQLTTFPIANLKQDYERLILDITRYTYATPEQLGTEPDKALLYIVKDFKNKTSLLDLLVDPTILEMFQNDIQFQIAMVILANELKVLPH